LYGPPRDVFAGEPESGAALLDAPS
jgi:hypothetical protein